MNLGKRVIFGAFTTIGARGVGVVCQLIVTAIASRIWSASDFGMWCLILSSMLLLNIFDFGASSALQNRIARSEDSEDFFFASLFLFTIPVVIAFFIWQPFGLILLRQPLSLCKGAFLGRQEAHRVALIEGFAAILGACIIALQFPFQVAIPLYLVSQIIPWIFATLFVIWRENWRLRFVIPQNFFLSVKPAILLWCLNLFSLLIISTDDWIFTYLFGIESVGDLTLVKRLYNLILLLNWSILTPMWSAYTLSSIRGDWEWLRRSLFKSTALLLSIVIVIGGWLYYFHPSLIEIWTGSRIAMPQVALALWVMTAALSLNASISTLLNGLGRIKIQVISNGCAALINFGLSLLWGKQFGMPGVIWATSVSFILVILVNFLVLQREKIPKIC
ncbi:MAG: polysaccharide biosynthesis C-terminal domain-containing protein [Simkaniaceae bacterium]|nr:polysaccharide biosynthesis C-terminal domain-containing protein [Simkaniaceae bacterium]